ncbi:hypothetical protein JQN72_08055 [Phycicoccus sp. CSK15P-2]|uniref:hypothetical protein n=1 Tax=Phycicoccus sp. CSK15P-2 TaxID=2807627 RepID=UPI00194FF275|nr:hypothetical protein [Phycicoccus sp. CSK15P-2]MBM6404196.1 hypothetical protein [Phycicoccus sp. CSK15P-2]
MEDVGVRFYVNWLAVPFFFVPALAIALYAAHASGGWKRPWIGVRPVRWFLLLFLLPPLGYLLLATNLVVHRRTPGAITGRKGASSVHPAASRAPRPNR